MITRALRFLITVIILLVGMWLLITPIYEWLLATFMPALWVQIAVGAAIVYIGVKIWKFHPW